MTRRIFCASCARPLRRGTYLLCTLGCGTRVCRNARCLQQHAPNNCPTYQAHHGLTEGA